MNNFKKIIVTILIGALSICLVGCSKKNNSIQEKYLSVQQIKQEIEKDNLLEIQPVVEYSASEYEMLKSIEYKIEDGVILQAADNTRLQDIMIIKAKTNEDAEIIENELIIYQKYLKEESSYQAGLGTEQDEESAGGARVGREGKFVYLVASPNLFAIEEKILSFIK